MPSKYRINLLKPRPRRHTISLLFNAGRPVLMTMFEKGVKAAEMDISDKTIPELADAVMAQRLLGRTWDVKSL